MTVSDGSLPGEPLPPLPPKWRRRSAKRQPRRDLAPSLIRESQLEPCYRAFGLWVRKRRLPANMTQRELAERLGVSREWVAASRAAFSACFSTRSLLSRTCFSGITTSEVAARPTIPLRLSQTGRRSKSAHGTGMGHAERLSDFG